jgi:hypothetical protein
VLCSATAAVLQEAQQKHSKTSGRNIQSFHNTATCQVLNTRAFLVASPAALCSVSAAVLQEPEQSRNINSTQRAMVNLVS